MNTKTHRRIADIIYNNLDNSFQKIIDLKAFKKGSVFPDLNIIYRFKEHTYKGSIHIVKRLIDNITENTLSPEKLGFKLGVISHFVTDYCCAYHSNKTYMKKNLKHRRYEQKAEKELNILENSVTGPKLYFLNTLEEEIQGYLSDFHSQDVTADYKRDLSQAFTMTNSLVQLILDKHKEQFESKPAFSLQGGGIFPNTRYANISILKLRYKYIKLVEPEL